MRNIGQGTAIRFSAIGRGLGGSLFGRTCAKCRGFVPCGLSAAIDPRTKLFARDQYARHKTAGDEHKAHYQRSGKKQFACVADAVRTFNQRHDRNARLKPGKAESESREARYRQKYNCRKTRELE